VLAPLTAVWANLHGGFLAGIAYIAVVAAGLALMCNWGAARRYATLAGVSAAASLLNPYGWQLHAHIAGYLQSDFIRSVVQEFQAPTFRGESARHYEIVLIAGVATAGLLVARKQFVDALAIFCFAHMSLASARHIPLYVIVAAPAIGSELTRAWTWWVAGRPPRATASILHQLSADLRAGLRRVTPWCLAGVFLLIVMTPRHRWPADFSPELFPAAMATEHAPAIRSASRVLTTDQWGDYLIYRFYPDVKVFIDGRSDFYGEAHCREYLALMTLTHRWSAVLEQYGFDLALIPVKWPLASVLKLRNDWRVIADDGSAILFARTGSIQANGFAYPGRKY
jgi:hypothetical protein